MKRPDRIDYFIDNYGHGDFDLDKDKYIEDLEEYISELEISDASKEKCTIEQHGEIKELKQEIRGLRRKMQVFEDAFINAETFCSGRKPCIGECDKCEDLGISCSDIRHILEKGEVDDLFI